MLNCRMFDTDWGKFDDAESGHFFFILSPMFHKKSPLIMASSGPPKPKGKAKVQVCHRTFSRLFYSLDGGFTFLLFSPRSLGKWSKLTSIFFKRGWFNHQLLFDFWTYLGWSPVLGLVFWVVSNILYFHPYLAKIPNLTNIFQIGWNHQPVLMYRVKHFIMNVSFFLRT